MMQALGKGYINRLKKGITCGQLLGIKALFCITRGISSRRIFWPRHSVAH